VSDQPAENVTRVLQAAADGDPKAAAELLPLIYRELRGLARAQMAKTPPGNTLQPTALVHEAYIRVVGKQDPSWNSRGHFFAAAAQAMRQILVDQARRKGRVKHGGGRGRVSLSKAEPVIEPPADDVIALDEALAQLEKDDPRKAKIIMLRYFAGLTEDETAAALGLSAPTVRRECRFARALLSVRLAERDPDE
jgi:RNA polymerase sigma factor (TIGR02999 family)